ncbi:MAG TPA: RNA polymerase sigma factor [Acidimicrobiia bacterium]|nr:RNA polymerase sigma factor [Acidimicrobiia bacterium]
MVESTTPTDAEVIAASLADPTRFGEIFTRHHDAVYRFASRRVGVGEAADITAEVFLRALKGRHRYHLDRPNCLPWLYGIGVNVIGDHLRRVKRRSRIYLKAQETALNQDDFTTPLVDRVDAESAAPSLNEALGRLGRKDRETLLLFAIDRLTYSEVALALGVPIGTVGSRILRARRKIMEQIPDLGQITGHGGTDPEKEGRDD